MPLFEINDRMFVEYECPCGGMRVNVPAESVLLKDIICACVKCGKSLTDDIYREVSELMCEGKDDMMNDQRKLDDLI